MAGPIHLPHGVLLERDHEVVIEIPINFTNVQEEEQLRELTKVDSLFLSCKTQEMKDGNIFITYNLPKGYKPLKAWEKAPLKMKQTIAENILNINNIQGTQFTTYIHPDNIYCNKEGNVKFAHRGIRSVLPPNQVDGKEFIFQIKCLIISIFTGKPFDELHKKRLTDIPNKQQFVKDLGKAKSLTEISEILSSDAIKEEEIPARKIEKEEKQPNIPLHVPIQQMHQAQQVPEPKPSTANERKFNKKWIYALGILVIGLCIGSFVTYLSQSKPHSIAIASSNNEMKKMQTQIDETKKEKENLEQILSGYKHIFAGEREKAIEVFSAIENLSEEEQQALAKQYIEENNPESLSKAANLDPSLHSTIAAKLVSLNSDEARDVLTSLQSDSPSVQIEQAWINKEYDQVIAIANDQLKEDNRAKLLAANSYLQQGKTNEAYALATELGDKPLQIAAKKQQIENVKKDTKRTEEEIKKEVEKINEEIKKLNEAA